MNDFLKHFLDVLTDKTISLSRRTLTVIFLLLIIYLANDTFSFSFNHRIDKRIEQIKSINEIYPSSMRDSIALKSDLDIISSQIRERKPIVYQLKNLYNNIASGNLMLPQKIIVLRLVSGTIVFLLIFLFFTLTEEDIRQRTLVQRGIFVMALVVNLLLFIIPNFNNLWINYLLNILVSVSSIVLVTIWGNRKKQAL